ncbi:MAG: hypothetical protein RTV31_13770 [Candidatus Thorarchaeota archaeon]
MISRRTLIVTVAVGLLLLGATPRSVSADITGNTYNFSAVWLEQSYQVDNAIVLDETVQGTFSVSLYNITPSDSYEYTFTGMNYYPYMFSPFADERNGSVAFQDNKVYFDLDTTDVDGNNLTEDYDLDMFPYYSGSSPGFLFFVNPVWSTHTTDWNTAVNTAENRSGVTSITDSIGEGEFSFQIVIGIEYNHSVYNYMNGSVDISFYALYDPDGVLSSWDLQHVTSSTNENHTIVQTQIQRFTRGVGAGVPLDPIVTTTLTLVGVAGVGGIIVGAVIGKKYLD